MKVHYNTQTLRTLALERKEHTMYAALLAPNARVRLDWTTGEWSACSQTCGRADGMQVRRVGCEARMEGGVARMVLDQCERYMTGKERPPEAQLCAETPCPDWVVAAWSEVSVIESHDS